MSEPREWPETPNLRSLRDRVPTGKDLIVSFVTSDGIERAVWDNGCYYEPYMIDPVSSDWIAENIEDTERWSEEMNEVYGEACIHLGELGGGEIRAAALSETKPSVWITRSDMDGYFVAVFVSPAGDIDAARVKAWEVYVGGHRSAPERPGDEMPGWAGYHTDPRGLSVFELGDSYVGSDGEGHIEVDEGLDPTEPWEPQHPGAAMRCEA